MTDRMKPHAAEARHNRRLLGPALDYGRIFDEMDARD